MALETMDLQEVRSAMEGILFAAGEPVNIDRICLALELDKPTAEQVLQELGDYYAFERRGIRLVRMENCYQLCSAPDYADIIRIRSLYPQDFGESEAGAAVPACAGGADHHRLLSADHARLCRSGARRGQLVHDGTFAGA